MAQALLNKINNSQILSEKNVNKNFNSDNKNNFESLFEKTKNDLSQKETEKDITNESHNENKTLEDNTSQKKDIREDNHTKENSMKESSNTEENSQTQKEDTNSNSENNLIEEIQNTIEEIIPEETEEAENKNLTMDENTDMNITNTEENPSIINNIINTSQAIVNTINETAASTSKTDTENENETEEDDLNVTLNGKSLNTIFDNIDSNNTTEETTSNNIVNLNKKETTTIEKTDTKNIEEIIDEDVLKDLNIENIEAETSSNNSSENPDLMQNQSAEEQGIKAMFQTEGDFADVKLDNTLKPTQNIQTNKTNTTTDIGPSKIIEQISKQLEGLNNNSKVNIVLNPESLGKVSVQLINTKEGLSAQFTVATQEAKNLIMKGLDGLKDTLMAHGVSVDNVTVKMNETQESNYQADWTEQEGSKGGNKEQNSKREEENKQKFAETMFTIENEENGKV